MNETQMSLFIIMAEHAIAAIQGGSFRDGVHTFKEKAKFTAGKGMISFNLDDGFP